MQLQQELIASILGNEDSDRYEGILYLARLAQTLLKVYADPFYLEEAFGWADGRPTTYLEVLQYALSASGNPRDNDDNDDNEEGTPFADLIENFKSRNAIPSTVVFGQLLAATGLLLVDAVVEAADMGNWPHSLHMYADGRDCLEDIRLGSGGGAALKVQAARMQRFSDAGKKSAEVRQELARAKPEICASIRAKLLKAGEEPARIAKHIASKIHVTPDAVRKALRAYDKNPGAFPEVLEEPATPAAAGRAKQS